jgi:hypothetical protein
MQGFGKSMKRKLVQAAAVATVAAALGAAPAQAVLDEDGGIAHSGPAVQVSEGGFDWGDAGIGIAIGAGAGALALGTTLALRRPRAGTQEAARPAVR